MKVNINYSDNRGFLGVTYTNGKICLVFESRLAVFELVSVLVDALKNDPVLIAQQPEKDTEQND